jgi:hypothetical protein
MMVAGVMLLAGSYLTFRHNRQLLSGWLAEGGTILICTGTGILVTKLVIGMFR